MATAEIIYNRIPINIQCNENEKYKDILNRFCIKVKRNKNEISFLYGGNIINENKSFNELSSSEDKQRKKMSILVTDNSTNESQNNKLKIYKNILCPQCQDVIRIEVKDFKIKLFDCSNGHIIDDLSFLEFYKSQIKDESKIICDICHNMDKSKTFNNSFFICNTCNKNICPLCVSSHNNNHIKVDYEEKYFKCKMHNDSYILYCNDCKKNICILCEKDHLNHNKVSLGVLIQDKNKLEENKNNLRNFVDKC